MKKYIHLLIIIAAIIYSVGLVSSVKAATASENMLIVFDASGSMTEQFGNASRIDTAKSTISDLVNSLDSNTLVGLRALAQEKKTTKTDACKVTALLQPFTSDHAAVLDQVNSLQAIGTYTPLAYTLQQAAGDFTVGQNNVLILMTDGQENCGGNPSQAAAALKAAGIQVKTYVIGLGADAATRSQLSGIATAGGGSYYDATDATSLAASFNAIQQKEHPVDKTNTDSLLGTEVTGGNGFQTAVPIVPGMYHLSHNQLPSQFDYFKMDVVAGDVITYSVQSSENSIKYDAKTNTFSQTTDHDGTWPGMKIYSATRAEIGNVMTSGASHLEQHDLTISDSGTIYFLIGNNNSGGYDFTNMSKSDLFTIKIAHAASAATAPATGSTDSTSAGATTGTTDNNTGSTDTSGSNQADPIPQNITDATNAAGGIVFTIIWSVVVAGVLLLLVIGLIIYFVVKGKKKPVTPSLVSATVVSTPAASPVVSPAVTPPPTSNPSVPPVVQ